MNNFNEKYSDRQLINRSQWADTYKAVNSITKDIVTLKVIINNSNNKEYIDSLKKEVSILKEMENTNLICINTMGSIVGKGNTYLYIESENFSGISLKEKLQSGNLSGVEAIKILRQVAEGLKEFHFKSLVYGKLDCNNIYIDENGNVKVDTLAYLEEKDFYISSKEEFSEEEDIYSLGVVLFELINGNTDFKPGKCKNKISDESLFYIIDRCTNKKTSTYEDLNEFIIDANNYLEYGKESTIVTSEEEAVIEDNAENHDENQIKKNPYKTTPLQIIRNLGACLLVFLLVATIINGGSLFNNKKSEKVATTKPAVVTQPEEETTEPEEEEVIEEEAPIVEQDLDNDTTDNQLIYNNTDDIYNNDNRSNNYRPSNNNTSNNYRPSNGNTNSNKNNNTNNNTNSNKNNNTSSNTNSNKNNNTNSNTNSNKNNNTNNSTNNNGSNNGGGKNPTNTPGNDPTTPGDGSAEETPTPEPTPEPDPGTGESDIELESEDQ